MTWVSRGVQPTKNARTYGRYCCVAALRPKSPVASIVTYTLEKSMSCCACGLVAGRYMGLDLWPTLLPKLKDAGLFVGSANASPVPRPYFGPSVGMLLGRGS
jgi:hypothetical protein